MITMDTSANGYDGDGITTDITVSKLSKLQRFMLTHALANRQREERREENRGVDLYYAEVMVEYYGFPSSFSRVCPHGQHFDRTAIGKGRYNAASAAISRASLRLHQRNLTIMYTAVHGRWSGLNLTDSGMIVATRLATDSPKPKGT